MAKSTVKFWVPLRKAVPSATEKDSRGRPLRIIEGWASVDTGKADLQGDIVDIEGIDDRLLTMKKTSRDGQPGPPMGVLNWEHGEDPASQLGRILEVKKSAGAYYIKGYLFYGDDPRDPCEAVWKTLSNNPPEVHGYGMSLQGGVKARNPIDRRRISKCVVTKVTITPQDINTQTWVDAVRKGALDPMGIELRLEDSEEGAMKKSSAAALDKSATKIIGQDPAKAAGYLKKALALFGLTGYLSDTELQAMAKSQAAETEPDDDENQDEENDMAKGCSHSSASGKFCSDCGEKMSKGLSVERELELDPTVHQALDALPVMRKLAKAISNRLDATDEGVAEVIQPMLKSMAASLATAEEVKGLLAKQEASIGEMQKGIAGLVEKFGALQQQPATDVRKSVDAAAAAAAAGKETAADKQPQASQQDIAGAVIYRAKDQSELNLMRENLRKSLEVGHIGITEFAAYSADLDTLGAAKVVHPQVDLLRPIQNQN